SEAEIKEAVLLARENISYTYEGSFSSYFLGQYPARKGSRRDRTGGEERFNKVRVHVDSLCQTTSELSEAGKKLSLKIHHPLTVHFICEDADRDADLMKSFIEPIAVRNPFTIWNIVVESKKRFSLPLAERVVRSIPAKERTEYFRNVAGDTALISFCGIFPWEAGAGKPGSTGPDGTFPYYWGIDVGKGAEWRTLVQEALQEERGRGIVVDFDRSLELPSVLEAARFMEEEAGKRKKAVHYRNIALAYATAKKRHAGCVVESIIEIDKEMAMRRTLGPGVDTNIALLKWQMNLGKKAEAIVKPVTYDQPFR
ncbi:MAG: hypothetical protein ACYC5N_10255, partial [Endomicrobiales bacterium]